MKTTFIPTLLALIIHAMVNGQSLSIRENGKSKEKNENVIGDYSRLVKAAEYYDSHSRKIKDESKGRQQLETAMMIEEADELKINALLKELDAAKLAARINQKAFEQNNKTIRLLAAIGIKDIDSKDLANNLVSDANTAMNSAKQLRKEARGLLSVQAQLGYMGNAEEKEFVALRKQEKAINVLEKASMAAVVSMDSNVALELPANK